MDPYAMHLTMAPLVGASFVAVSAYYMHRKTLNQLLEFAKTLEKDSSNNNNLDDGGHYKKGGRRNNGVYIRGGGGPLPDVMEVGGGGEDGDGFLVGLPKLHTLPEGW